MLEESPRGIIFRVYKKLLNPFRCEKSEFHGLISFPTIHHDN